MSIRYIAGHPEKGQSPAEGFDCSGFVRFILLQCGLLVPDFIGMDGIIRPIRHASEFWDHYGIGTHEVRPGDLIFFSRHGEWPTHVGIVRDEESFIHAPGRNGTKVEVSGITPQDIEPKAAAHAILYTRNPIGYKSPVVPHEQPSYRYHQRAV